MAEIKPMNSREQLLEAIQLQYEPKRIYLEKLFEKCPEYVVDSAECMRIPAKKTFLHAGEKCKNIYILLKGKARALEYQKSGNLYVFKEFSQGYILGDYECLAKEEQYVVSISAMTACEALVIPANVYRKWMQEDHHALLVRMENLMRALLLETQRGRKHLFLNSRERLLLYLIETYEEQGGKNSLKIRKTQDALAERLGVDKRTVQRSIKDLKEDEMISLESGKILIEEEHYHRMKEYEKEKLLSAE